VGNNSVLTLIEGEVATLTLNRPQFHNAFDEQMIEELLGALESVSVNDSIRVVILAANGSSFSAGADLGWMRRASRMTENENLSDARRLACLLSTLNKLAKPTIALVHGPAYGGGIGILCCCDIVLATPACRFKLSEVRLGLIPAVIMPYVIAAIGARHTRRYALTAETIHLDLALKMGLVHIKCKDDKELKADCDKLSNSLLSGGAEAIGDAKNFLLKISGYPIDSDLIEESACRIARRRTQDEAKEGIEAFLEKRAPVWVK
tara:strand:- start:495 stop:1283 length:789 start_codon:yes stop_codon:yes gene_type:complete